MRYTVGALCRRPIPGKGRPWRNDWRLWRLYKKERRRDRGS